MRYDSIPVYVPFFVEQNYNPLRTHSFMHISRDNCVLGELILFTSFSLDYSLEANCIGNYSANVSQSTWARPEPRSATPVGNSTVWSMGSKRTADCQTTDRVCDELTTIRSIHSSARQVPASTFPEPSTSISNPPFLVCMCVS